MKTPICQKPGFRRKKYTISFTGHLVQFLNGFAIFQTPQGTQGVWKIARKPNPLVKFGCATLTVKLDFFQKMRFFFKKFVKNIKKLKIIFFLLKKYA